MIKDIRKMFRRKAEITEQRFLVNVIFASDKNVGRRLRIKALGIRIKIIVGNPITYCEVTRKYSNECNTSISICNPKDTYNWKICVKEAFAHAIKDFNVTDRRYLYFKLFQKYPELKEM